MSNSYISLFHYAVDSDFIAYHSNTVFHLYLKSIRKMLIEERRSIHNIVVASCISLFEPALITGLTNTYTGKKRSKSWIGFHTLMIASLIFVSNYINCRILISIMRIAESYISHCRTKSVVL